MPKINRNAYFFEIVAEKDKTLDFEVALLPNVKTLRIHFLEKEEAYEPKFTTQ